jgi:chromosome segregation ATPase
MERSFMRWSKRVCFACVAGALFSLPGSLASAQDDGAAGNTGAEPPIDSQKEALDGMLDRRATKNDESAAVQKEIDVISDETDDLLARYRTTLKQIDSIRVYNGQLRGLIGSQEEELASLQDQLDRVEEVGRSVTPLMLRMIDALEATVDLDIPFLLEERTEDVAALRKLMTKAAVSTSEKYRMIMEAYQDENEYGRTIEAYRANLEIDGGEVKVDFLRFGRIALVYQTLDGRQSGVWNKQTKSWDQLDANYRTAVREGLRIARKQSAPDLIRLPLPVPAGGQG